MKRQDFKEITEEYVKFCEKLIKNNGVCTSNTNCCECPFSSYNAINGEPCCPNNYSGDTGLGVEDVKLVKSAQEFLQLFERPKYTTTNPILNEKLKNGDKEVTKLVEKTFEIFKDNVNSPNHYKLEGLDIESIDVIFAVVRSIKNGVIADCVGNILKYVMRAEKKNGLEDYKKARKYLDWCIEEKEEKK